MYSVFGFQIDGGWVDLGSVCCGAAWAIKQRFRRQRRSAAPKKCWSDVTLFDRQTGIDFATGTSLFPFFLLALSPFSSQLLTGLLQGGKVVLSVAGMIALASIMRDSEAN